MVEGGQGLPNDPSEHELPDDPLQKATVVAGVSNCFLTQAGLRLVLEEWEPRLSAADTASDKEAIKAEVLGLAAEKVIGHCGLLIDVESSPAGIAPCIKTDEQCPTRRGGSLAHWLK